MNGISVILCCYNSAYRLPNTLKFLSNQIINSNLNWEIILIDNNSSDNTSHYAIQHLEKLTPAISYKVINEIKTGLVFARQRGVAEAIFDYLIFCDDDNWLCDTYVQQVYDYFEQLPPNVGVIGGHGEAIFEKESLNGKGIYAGATGKQSDFEGEILNIKGVYGAGMAIKKEIFSKIKSLDLKFLLSDRVGEKMTCGGDTEICMLSLILGFKIHYYSNLKFFHYMPNNRLTAEHCHHATLGVARSKFYLFLYNIIIGSNKPKSKLYFFPFIEFYNSTQLLFNLKKNSSYKNDVIKLIGFERLNNVFSNLLPYYLNIKYFFYLVKIKNEMN
jgi:glycosyltransferase involved in cell wall biosynthesis